jgi:trans-aconitate methyltransferase
LYDILQATLLAITFLAAASIIWFSLATGIGPVPSTRRARQAMLAVVQAAPAGPVMDLGSGWGTLAIAAARRFPEREVVGYELSWVPWAVSWLLKHAFALNNLSFRREDFLRADVSKASVLLCYLFHRGMQPLAEKLAREGPPAVLVSNTFALPSAQAEEVTQLDDLYRTRIYVYRWRR